MAVPQPGGRWCPGHTAGPTTLGSGVMEGSSSPSTDAAPTWCDGDRFCGAPALRGLREPPVLGGEEQQAAQPRLFFPHSAAEKRRKTYENRALEEAPGPEQLPP